MSPWRVPRPMPRAIGADSREGLGVPGGNLVEPSREASKSGVEAVEEWGAGNGAGTLGEIGERGASRKRPAWGEGV